MKKVALVKGNRSKKDTKSCHRALLACRKAYSDRPSDLFNTISIQFSRVVIQIQEGGRTEEVVCIGGVVVGSSAMQMPTSAS